MLEPILHILAKQRNVLASASPRRRELLNSVGLPHEVVPSSFIEDLDKDSFSHPCEYVKANAKEKAIEVWKRLARGAQDVKPDLVIGADTVVVMDDIIYEKPKDKEDAFQMLTKLSGQQHSVFTGVALVTSSSASALDGAASTLPAHGEHTEDFVVTTFHEATVVTMTQMSPEVIKAYIETGEPMDKAGSYAIQGTGGTLVEGIKGDFYNVVGIPLHRLCRELYHMYMD
ncbi:putative bifunctional dTTP/UTP pyrophosphatase/methyltransferase protein [Halotydeus destructor]|nr:putative bifunctional dTTP/UTP pyrophosphatase/methyltransferase protein [Halotydeus destructor]